MGMKIKICGLSRDCDIRFVNEALPDYAGFILMFPGSRRNVFLETAAALRKQLNPAIRAVGVFVDRTEEEVLTAADYVGVDVIQLHGHESETYIRSLKEKTSRPIWKAFRVRTKDDVREAAESQADAILLDNGYGTGESFDWTLLAGLSRPFYLAGGLTPETICEAERLLKPELVDISSGVETDGYKDRRKIMKAIQAAHEVNTEHLSIRGEK